MRLLVILSILFFAVSEPSDGAANDFAFVDLLAVHTRPNAQEMQRISDSSPLIRALHTNRVEFYKLRYLFPQKFRVAQAQDLQKILDEAILAIASTETGKQAICPFAVDSDADLQSYFQVSGAAAHTLREGCEGRPAVPAITRRLRIMREARPPFQPTPLVPFKKFVFLFAEDKLPEIEAYSSRQNITYIILDRRDFSFPALVRTIAHELAVSYDQLSRLGYLMDPVTWDQGLNYAFGRSLREDPVFADIADAPRKEMVCALRDPALKYAATAQRAFQFEDRVSKESNDLSPAVAASGSCEEILAKNSVLLQGMARAVSWETGWYEAACGKIATDPAQRVKQVLGRIRVLTSATLYFRESRKAMSLCDLLLNPRVGPGEPDLHSGGPRPRMGGGWGARAESSMMERAARGQKISAAEEKRLGEALSFSDTGHLYEEEDRGGTGGPR